MAILTLRTVKGSPLTNLEVDNNFANLNSDINAVTYDPGTAGNVLTSTGSTFISQGLPASGLSYVGKNANYTVLNNQGVLSNTALGAFTVTLPLTPVIGNQVVIADSYGSWSSNNLTIARNGSTIENEAADLVCDISGASVHLVYSGNTWDVFASVGGAGGEAVTLTGTQTLTNKTLTAPNLGTPSFITLTSGTGLPLTTGVTGTLPVANGGTGVTTSTGTGNIVLSTSPVLTTPNLGTPSAVVLTSGTGLPISTGVSGLGSNVATFLATPTAANLATVVTDETGSGNLVFSTNPVLTTPTLDTATLIGFGTIRSLFETGNVVASAPGANVQIDLGSRAVQYFTSNAANNFTINFRNSAAANLNSVMSVGNTVTSAVIVTNGSTAYYPTVYQVDGAAVTPKWQGGTAPTQGNASSTDTYVFTIVKTGSAAFTVLASQTRFA